MFQRLEQAGIVKTEVVKASWPNKCAKGCGATTYGYITVQRIGPLKISKPVWQPGEISYPPGKEAAVLICTHQWRSGSFI